MSAYVLSGEALAELDEIWRYIAQDDIGAADDWIAKLLDACDLLARNPLAGHRRKDLTEDALLFWPVGKYLIIYRTLEDSIEGVAVTQGPATSPPICAAAPELHLLIPPGILSCYGHRWLRHCDRHPLPGGRID